MSALAAEEQPSRYFDVPVNWPGPVTLSRLRRTRLVYMVIASAGFALGVFGPSPMWRSFGFGLVLPGAGFLHHLTGGPWNVAEHLLLAAVSAVAFVVAVVLWWWCGVVLLPILEWLGAAVLAASMPHHETFGPTWLVVAAIGAAMVVAETARKRKVDAQIASGRADNEQHALRAAHMLTLRDTPPEELSAEDLAALRFALDRGLQPVGEFKGFHFGDQWQLSATRYQVFTLGWALALTTANALPAMRGYLQQAQLNLLEKTRDPRLWSYWKWENLWGNFRLGADPLAHDNIMYSGYVGQQFGLYQAATGDLRHDAPGAYTLVAKNGRTYEYDVPSLVEVLTSQYESSPFGAWPCEPNWVYLFCNTTGGIAIRAYDAAHGTSHWDRVAERFDRYVAQEFTRPDGNITELRSCYTGFTPPFMNGPVTNLNAAAGLHALSRDRAEGLWWMSREHVVESVDGVPRVIQRHITRTADPGNLKRVPGFSFGMMLHGAREFGDDQFATAVETAMAERLETVDSAGVRSYTDVSIWGHALLLMGRVGRKNGFHDLATRGTDRLVLDGPLIVDVPYPDVLVARATSDGAALDAVVLPGREPGRFEIGVGQLRPGRSYRCDASMSSTVVADPDGFAAVTIEIAGRTPARLVPID